MIVSAARARALACGAEPEARMVRRFSSFPIRSRTGRLRREAALAQDDISGWRIRAAKAWNGAVQSARVAGT